MSTVLITRSSSDFGKSTAILFASRGWNVIATMREPAAGVSFDASPNVFAIRLDVQDEASIATAISQGVERFGRIDVLVNNAGFGLFGTFEETPREQMLLQFDVNVFGVMDVKRALLPHFRSNRSGVIVSVSSGAGIFGLPLIAIYSASKFAPEGFSESISYELADLGIRVKIVEPGGVTSTNFGQRGAKEAARSAPIFDYDPFLAAAPAVFGRLAANAAGGIAQGVAEVIFSSVTDGTNELRYVATDGVKPLLSARREASETEYMALMRSNVAPKVL